MSTTKPRYTVIPSRVWKATDGRTASPYGSCPWTSDADKPNWKIENVGYTVRNNVDGTVGVGKAPTTYAGAVELADKLNALHTR